MTDPEDPGLRELLQGPGISIADEDQAFGSVVARARTRVRRRRVAFVGAVLVVVAVAGSVIAVNRRDGKHVQVQARPLTAADVTFAVFDRPATPADALPAALGGKGFEVDPAIGSRRAIQTGSDQIYLYANRRLPSGGERYCVVDSRGTDSAASCATEEELAVTGGHPVSTTGRTTGSAVFGIVPDFVTRVSYRGRDVPIVNNAFVVDGADDISGVTFSTPDGDKTPLSTSVTTARSSSLRAVLPPAAVAPVSDECTMPLLPEADGNVRPLLCARGIVNTLAWAHDARGQVGGRPVTSSKVMALGREVTATNVLEAMCSDFRNIFGTNPRTLSAERLASAYYGWHFTDRRITYFSAQGCPAS